MSKRFSPARTSNMKKLTVSVIVAVWTLCASAQPDLRPVVGVAQFSCQEPSPYTGIVTEKVVEMLTNTRRFRVVDRTSIDKIHAELELQKSEAFLDSKNLVEQDVAVAAEKMITGHIVKIPVYAIRNGDGTRRGFKASVGFEMKLVDVATGTSTEATSFQGKASEECLSPEAAVTMAMQDVADEIAEWFRVNFPVAAKVARVLDEKTVLVSAGAEQGVKAGDVMLVETVEMLDGAPYHRSLGELKISKVAGPYYSECAVPKKMMAALRQALDGGAVVLCTQKIKK